MTDHTPVPARPRLPESFHLNGCPAPEDRTESYPLPRAGGGTVLIVRCIECGGQFIFEPEEET